jgi:hypothetical protein
MRWPGAVSYPDYSAPVPAEYACRIWLTHARDRNPHLIQERVNYVMSRQARARNDDASAPPGARRPLQELSSGGQSTDAAVTSPDTSSGALRQFATIATNVAILTALLVYFGWRRMETQAAQIGVDQDIFGYGTRDYLLRSVGPVLQLLAIVAAAGLVAVYLNRGLHRRAEKHGPADPALRITLFVMTVAGLLLPLLAYVLGYVIPAIAFVAFPLTIAAGVLFLVYASHLRRELQGSCASPAGWRSVERASVVIVLCVTGFWATSNYAEVLGSQLADAIINHVSDLTSVTVYAPQRLAISASGTHETAILGTTQVYHYRYTGLRLLGHTGNRYFLISDLWKPSSGVIIVLEDSPPLRFEFGENTAMVMPSPNESSHSAAGATNWRASPAASPREKRLQAVWPENCRSRGP